VKIEKKHLNVIVLRIFSYQVLESTSDVVFLRRN